MGYRTLSLNLPTDYREEDLRLRIKDKFGIGPTTYTIEKKSLDARRKSNIRWQVTVGVSSPHLKGGLPPEPPDLNIPRTGRGRRVLIVGSGPAGIFAALVLQRAGFLVTLIERGKNVEERSRGIAAFEGDGAPGDGAPGDGTGPFDEKANYLFGEGGAGTFSDGKLTSRSKHISAERRFILDTFIRAGGPEEIAYLAHPHLGSDKLKVIVQNLRSEFLDTGGSIHFETRLEDLNLSGGTVKEAVSDRGSFGADYFILAPGHSSYETYRMLLRRGVQLRPKNFAIGCRVEHPRQLINQAQWGKSELPGVKAAEYRLSASPDGLSPVYTFCMCPGGVVVPSGAYPEHLVVNGMSYYARDLPFSNAACVAAVNPFELFADKAAGDTRAGDLADTGAGEDPDPKKLLEWMETLERSFYHYSNSYRAPACSIDDFIRRREPKQLPDSSYKPGLVTAPLWELLPRRISLSLAAGLQDFSRRLRGFENGTILGLESKTSAPLQALRENDLSTPGLPNLFIAGEGSGWSGGIISSAADGIRVALELCRR